MTDNDGNEPDGALTPEAMLEQLAERQDETSILPMETRDRLFFAYDVMMDHTIVSRYTKGLLEFKVVKLVNHCLTWPWYHPQTQTALPSILRSNDSGEAVWGLLYNANKTDFTKLERYIRVPTRNYRKSIRVFDQGGREYYAFTYAFTDRRDENLKPSAEYLRQLIEIARERKLPDEWLSKLGTIDTA